MRGLDAVMYLKFLKYMTVLFLLYPISCVSVGAFGESLIIYILAPIGLGVLMPLDATGTEMKKEGRSGVAALSLSNVPDDSNIVWMHGIYAIFCTIVTFVFLYQLYDKVFSLQSYPLSAAFSK